MTPSELLEILENKFETPDICFQICSDSYHMANFITLIVVRYNDKFVKFHDKIYLKIPEKDLQYGDREYYFKNTDFERMWFETNREEFFPIKDFLTTLEKLLKL